MSKRIGQKALALAAIVAVASGAVLAQDPNYYSVSGADLLPPNAKPGECYARLWVPPTYRTETMQVLKTEASERIEIIPARYEWAEERVLVKEASERIEVVPAAYGWVEERILVKPAGTRIEQIPARYETVTERVVDTPAHTIWKEGRGPIEKLDNATGEIMCLVEVPATYKTVTKRILAEPAKTRSVEIPAEYSTVKKQVVTKPAATRTVTVPAEYKNVRVRRLVEPEREVRTPVPAEYQTVTKTTMVADGGMQWREVLCETNMAPGVITDIQRALKTAGYDPGPIDGVIGRETMAAIESYQRANGLAVGGITMSTLDKLGVTVR